MPVRPATYRRRKLSLTSLIDVIFLLLLFFMLSSTFSHQGEIPFLAAAADSGVMAAQPPLFLRLDGTSLSLNGEVIAPEQMLPAIASRVGDDPAPRVIVSVTGNATSQALVDVLVPLGRVPGAEITVVE